MPRPFLARAWDAVKPPPPLPARRRLNRAWQGVMRLQIQSGKHLFEGACSVRTNLRKQERDTYARYFSGARQHT